MLLSGQVLASADTKILVFGDSLSAAYGLEPDEGWVTLLEERLEDDNYPVTVANASVSGETTSGGVARLPAALQAHQPDLIILELGGNDGLRGLPVAQMRTNLQEMIELSLGNGAEVLLVGIQIPPNYGPRYTEPFYAQYQELAEAYDLALLPFLLEGIADNPDLMQNDGVHPVADAQSMIVDNIWPVLAPLLPAPQVSGES
ncbi:arylesterase [Pseudohongiella nitratireducens]|uniref:arylesterase n=1 Tax=Pseudohongiella nitratireducens TaxID=1768907 RepID=UPI0030EE4583|tara:strand:+ start:17789 stop:18394 length:606 start_codon:yes stop_codon:yes gene_type:complete